MVDAANADSVLERNLPPCLGSIPWMEHLMIRSRFSSIIAKKNHSNVAFHVVLDPLGYSTIL